MDISDPTIELWLAYDKNKSIDSRNKLFQYYSQWIKKISSYQYSKYKTDIVDWRDCVQNASMALLESISKYDISRGVPFEAFAYSRVKGAILNGLNDISGDFFKSNSVSDQSIDFADDLHFSDNFDESFDQFIDTVIDIAFSKLLDISSYRYADIGADPLDVYIVNAEEKKILSAVQKLPADLQFVVTSHYNNFLTFTQIAEQLTISKSRVSQLHREALKRLRQIYEQG